MRVADDDLDSSRQWPHSGMVRPLPLENHLSKFRNYLQPFAHRGSYSAIIAGLHPRAHKVGADANSDSSGIKPRTGVLTGDRPGRHDPGVRQGWQKLANEL